jgi:hypothetical protein
VELTGGWASGGWVSDGWATTAAAAWTRVTSTLAQIEIDGGGTPTSEPSAIETFAEENSMAIGVVLTLGFMAFGLVLIYASVVRNRRARAMVPTAEKHGLRYSGGDLYGCTQVAFPLFLEGDGRKVENVMSRTGANGLDVRVFDYAYYDEYEDENGKVHRTWKYFNCAMARHNGIWPVIRVTRERKLDKVAQKLGLPDIELESEAFNRLFVVQCEDRRFATTLLDPQMMEFLLHTEGRLTFETKGRWLLVIAPRLDDPADMVGLLGVADEFLRRIPSVIYRLYPEGADTEGGTAGAAPLASEGILKPVDSIAQVMREERRADWWDPTPGVEHDLDGKPVTRREENPWG